MIEKTEHAVMLLTRAANNPSFILDRQQLFLILEVVQSANAAATAPQPEASGDEPIATAYRNGIPHIGHATVITKLPAAERLPLGTTLLYARAAATAPDGGVADEQIAKVIEDFSNEFGVEQKDLPAFSRAVLALTTTARAAEPASKKD